MLPEGERSIIDVVVENIEMYMETRGITRNQLKVLCGNATVDNLLYFKSVNGCSLVSLQRIAGALGVKTLDLIEDWSE